MWRGDYGKEIKMIKVKDRYYFISERLVKKVFKKNKRYFVRLETDEIQEIDQATYVNLGGKL